MIFIKKIYIFFKKIIKKENNIKAIEEPRKVQNTENKKEFVNFLKIQNKKQKSKKRVETLKCVGDGLGIQPKITG